MSEKTTRFMLHSKAAKKGDSKQSIDDRANFLNHESEDGLQFSKLQTRWPRGMANGYYDGTLVVVTHT